MTLISIPQNPVPEGATSGFLRTVDGVNLRFARFPSRNGPRKGTIVLFHGRSEFIEKYFETVEHLTARGYAVATLDWRGQGLSDRALPDWHKGHVEDFAEYDLDLEAFVKEVVLPDCPAPHFAVAHSMGGAVLMRAAAAGKRWFDRTVLSAPMLALAGVGSYSIAGKAVRVLAALGLAKSYVPGGGATPTPFMPFAGNPLTSDAERFQRTAAVVEANQQLGIGGPSNGWLRAAFDVMDDFADPAYPSVIRHPMLVITAGNDTVVSTPKVAEFTSWLRAGAHLNIPGSRHEPLMERDVFREQFLAALEAFVPGSGNY